MTTPFNTAFASQIGSVISALGTTASIIRPGTPDTSTYPPTVGTPTTHGCTVVIDSYSAMDMASNAGIQVGDVKLLVSVPSLDITPGSGDSVKVSGDTYSVINVTTVQPGGVAVLYQIQGRKA
jgi:hypothetical protein